MSIIISNKKNQGRYRFILRTALIFFIFLAGEAVTLAAEAGINSTDPQPPKPISDKNAASSKPLPVAVPDVVFGKADAPITIIEYSSLTAYLQAFSHGRTRCWNCCHSYLRTRNYPPSDDPKII
jgi:hypothetical protein